MGKVTVKDVILKNHVDEIKEEKVRSVTIDMIADTGARAVGLPLPIIQELGLPEYHEVTVILSNGKTEKRTLYNDLVVQIGDRDSVFECIGKPENALCLLGQLVFETLDLVVDCPNERLIPNPEAPDGMMLYDDF